MKGNALIFIAHYPQILRKRRQVMIERLWRSLKYECVYLHAFETGSEVRQGIDRWIKHYNEQRAHSRLDDKTQDEAYWEKPRPGYAGPVIKLAA